jgi:hypothetical protein
MLRRVPAPLAWLDGALALAAGLAAARLAGLEGTALGVAQLVPAVVLLVAAAALLDAALQPAAEADAAATDAAVALAARAPWAELALVGAGELGVRARLRAETRAPEATVLLWLEPAREPWWRTAHPALAEVAAAAAGAPRRRRGRALPAGARPALALGGPDPELTELAAAGGVGLDARLRQSEAASSTK